MKASKKDEQELFTKKKNGETETTGALESFCKSHMLEARIFPVFKSLAKKIRLCCLQKPFKSSNFSSYHLMQAKVLVLYDKTTLLTV